MITSPTPIPPATYAERFPGCGIDPTAVVYEGVEIGRGTSVGPFAVLGYPGAIREATEFRGRVVIGAGVRLGAGVVVTIGTDGLTLIEDEAIVMNYVNVGHNARVGPCAEVGAGTVLAGWSEVGERAQVKIGCLVRNRVRVGAGAVVGMGSVVVRDVPEGARVMGHPARPTVAAIP